jgi:hypothetical protein
MNCFRRENCLTLFHQKKKLKNIKSSNFINTAFKKNITAFKNFNTAFKILITAFKI